MKPFAILMIMAITLSILAPTFVWLGLLVVAFFCTFLLGGVVTCSLSVLARQQRRRERSLQKDWREKKNDY